DAAARTARTPPSRRATSACDGRRRPAADSRASRRFSGSARSRARRSKWIQRVALAVDDEEGLVPEVAGEKRTIDLQIVICQNAPVAIQGQEARKRRRVAHRDVVRARAPVRYSRQHDEVLLNVQAPLHGVQYTPDVQQLIAAPPGSRVPRER